VVCSDENEEHGFWPWSAEANVQSYQGYDYAHDPRGRRWPLCLGKCSGGKCRLDRSKPGCCYRDGRKHGYGYVQDVQDDSVSTAYAPENLVCWDGEGSN
jgi:hypothetical protein